MALEKVNLRKILQLMSMNEKQLTSALKRELYQEKNKGGGGDFYAPFWSDAKNHVWGNIDLISATKIRIKKHNGRKKLYPLLTNGFLLWWNEKRRWINEDIEAFPETVKNIYKSESTDNVIKIENTLSLRVGDNTNKIIYPYFYEKPELSYDSARIGLWVLNKTLPQYLLSDIRILDILRGHAYSIDNCPLHGNEEHLFLDKYQHLMDRLSSIKLENV